MHRNLAQRLATTRAGHAFAALQFEARAMYRAHQQAVLAAQELARGPVEPAPRVRADIEPSAYAAGGIAMDDQRFGIAIHHGLDLVQAVHGHGVQRQQWRGWKLGGVTV